MGAGGDACYVGVDLLYSAPGREGGERVDLYAAEVFASSREGECG
nr:MAG TPA: hypothetical protein [Caudoviricetes sp.]